MEYKNGADPSVDVVEAMRHLHKNHIGTDFTFYSRDMCAAFRAHKFILAIRSPVLYNIIYGENRRDYVEITDVGTTAIDNLLRYVYDEDVELEKLSDITETKKLADRYEIIELEDKCRKRLSDVDTDICNVFDVLQLALEFENETKETECIKLIGSHKQELFESEQFAKLSFDSCLYVLCKLRETNLITEFEFLRYGLQWLETNNCLQSASSLLAEVDLLKLRMDEFVDIVISFPESFSNKEISRTMKEIRCRGRCSQKPVELEHSESPEEPVETHLFKVSVGVCSKCSKQLGKSIGTNTNGTDIGTNAESEPMLQNKTSRTYASGRNTENLEERQAENLERQAENLWVKQTRNLEEIQAENLDERHADFGVINTMFSTEMNRNSEANTENALHRNIGTNTESALRKNIGTNTESGPLLCRNIGTNAENGPLLYRSIGTNTESGALIHRNAGVDTESGSLESVADKAEYGSTSRGGRNLGMEICHDGESNEFLGKEYSSRKIKLLTICKLIIEDKFIGTNNQDLIIITVYDNIGERRLLFPIPEKYQEGKIECLFKPEEEDATQTLKFENTDISHDGILYLLQRFMHGVTYSWMTPVQHLEALKAALFFEIQDLTDKVIKSIQYLSDFDPVFLDGLRHFEYFQHRYMEILNEKSMLIFIHPNSVKMSDELLTLLLKKRDSDDYFPCEQLKLLVVLQWLAIGNRNSSPIRSKLLNPINFYFLREFDIVVADKIHPNILSPDDKVMLKEQCEKCVDF